MDFKTFKCARRERPVVVLAEEIPADLLTPASVFLALSDGRPGTGFLLESVEGGETVGRFSFIGVDPVEEITLTEDSGIHRIGRRSEIFGAADLFARIRSRLVTSSPPYPDADGAGFLGGWVGYLSYDCVRLFERLPSQATETLGHPWVRLGLYDSLVIFDHARQSARAAVAVRSDDDRPGDGRIAYDRAQRRLARLVRRLGRPLALPHLRPSVQRRIRANVTRRAFADGVRQVKRHIARGDIFQGVLSQRFTRPGPVRPFDVYRRLRRSNPSPYMYYLTFGDSAVAGSSPETLVQKRGPLVTTRPIAGTRPRGRDAQEDAARERQLRNSPKENAEHVMLVDLGRNDIGRVCRPGTVHTEEFGAVDRYSHVMHMVSRVTGRARRGVDACDVLAATFPAGTVSGAPKIRAMEIIEAIEPDRRGIYAGSVGYIDWWGDMDMAIAIRTAVMDRRGAYVQAGAGIVADSDPDREYDETRNKAAAPLAAVGGVWTKGGRP
ncbi:MAG TPA: anthranilate synthase component I [Acidobacteriota bacterium]|nr:anthranilate synthase component I [Acidobacteriota bacterium]